MAALTASELVRFGFWFFAILGGLFLILIVAVTIKPTQPKTRPEATPAQESDLDSKLQRLLDGYREALRMVESLPLVGLWPTSVVPMDAGDATGRWLRSFWGGVPTSELTSRKLVIRPFVRLWAETHIRRNLYTIVRLLGIRALAIRETDELKRSRSLESELSERVEKLFHWGRLRKALTKVMLLPTTLAPVAALFGALIEVNESETASLRRSFVGQLQAIAGGGASFRRSSRSLFSSSSCCTSSTCC